MLGDPLTLAGNSITWYGSYPAAAEAAVQGTSLNIIESSGRRIVRSASKASLATLSLSEFKLTTSHQAAANGRVRSMLRVDVSKLDASSVPHSTAVYVVIDQEAAVSSEATTTLSRALGSLLLLLTNATGANAQTTASTLAELLNGES